MEYLLIFPIYSGKLVLIDVIIYSYFLCASLKQKNETMTHLKSGKQLHECTFTVQRT